MTRANDSVDLYDFVNYFAKNHLQDALAMRHIRRNAYVVDDEEDVAFDLRHIGREADAIDEEDIALAMRHQRRDAAAANAAADAYGALAIRHLRCNAAAAADADGALALRHKAYKADDIDEALALRQLGDNKVKEFQPSDDIEELLNMSRKKGKPMMIEVYSPTCTPCKVFEPKYKQLAEANGKDVIFYKANIEDNDDLANSLNVYATPTIVAFKHGKEIGRVEGGDIQAVQDLNARLL